MTDPAVAHPLVRPSPRWKLARGKRLALAFARTVDPFKGGNPVESLEQFSIKGKHSQ